MTDRVDRTLARWRSSGHIWGQSDCLLSIGDYIAAHGGQDVAGRFRGTYDSEAGALAMKDAYGGAIGLVDLTGLAHTDDMQRGDVCVVDTGEIHVGALCTGSGVAMRLAHGVVELEHRFVRIVQAWKVP
jgi:hypothetical protein